MIGPAVWEHDTFDVYILVFMSPKLVQYVRKVCLWAYKVEIQNVICRHVIALDNYFRTFHSCFQLVGLTVFFKIYPVAILLFYFYPCRVKSVLVLVVVVVVVVHKGLGSSKAQLRGEQRHRVEFWSVSWWKKRRPWTPWEVHGCLHSRF